MDATFWALMPPVVAIVLALITKEVYVSLLIGILAGGLFYANFNVLDALETTFTIMGERVGSNTNIIVFLVLLGMLVALMSKSGASRAYGSWASRSIKTKRGALFATAGLGALIFVDDYFNCLTVGTVMRPVTERYKISKAKLAYIIDATAAPVCIIAPISSWAAAVGSSLPESSSLDGFSLFLQTIPFNLYALLTIVMVIFMIAMQFDFGKMKKAEAHPELGTAMSDEIDDSQAGRDRKGRVFDLVIPIITLIVLCIAAMLYTGGILEGKSIAGAFADCDSSLSLVLGSFFTIVLVFLLYIPRRVISFSEFAASLSSIGVSYRVSYSVALALRYIPDIQRDYHAISQAQQARGIELGKKEKLLMRLKNSVSILLPLILSSLQRIDVISSAMELRGFGKGSKRTWYVRRPFARRDFIALALSVVLLLVSLTVTIKFGRFYNPFV